MKFALLNFTSKNDSNNFCNLYCRKILQCICCFIFLIAPIKSIADTLNVPSEYSTIQGAIDAANDGDTVLVAPGTYFENINMDDFVNKNIILESSNGPEVTIIDGGSDGTTITGPVISITTSLPENSSPISSSTIIKGFTIQNGRNNVRGPGGIHIVATSPTIENNIIKINNSAIEIRASSSLIKDNIIENNTACCGSGLSSALLVHYYADSNFSFSPRIEGNIFKNNNATAIKILGQINGNPELFPNAIINISDNEFIENTSNNCGAIYSLSNSNLNIIQNIFVSNAAIHKSGGVCIENNSGTISIENNTFFKNKVNLSNGNFPPSTNKGSDLYLNTRITNQGPINLTIQNNNSFSEYTETSIYCDGTDQPSFNNNNFYNSNGDVFGGVCSINSISNDNISEDPLYIDPENNNFRLTINSPSIDTGNNNAPNLTTNDITGVTRILDGNNDNVDVVDIGAFEYNPNGIMEFSSNSLTFQENSNTASIDVCRIGGTIGNVSADYLTSDGTGINGVNYTSVSGTVSFTNGESGCKTIQIPLLDNNLINPDFNFSFNLTNPVGGTSLSNQSQTQVTINDNESFLNLSSATNKDRYLPGENVTLTLTVSNNSTASNATTAQNVVLTNTLPSELTFSSVQTTQGSCSGSQTLVCNLGSIGVGNSVTLTLVAIGTSELGSFTDTISITADPINQATTLLSESQTITIGLPTAQEYFPIVPLTTYTYVEEGTPPLIETDIVLLDKANINGVETNIIKDEDGDTTYFTIDDDGYKVYRYDYADGDSIEFSPALTLINGQPTIGENYNSSGIATYIYPGNIRVNASYNLSCSIPRIENVSVLYGTFDALRIDCNLDISGFVLGTFIESNGISSVWIVEGLGEVLEIGSGIGKINGNITETFNSKEELQSITPPPEITSLNPNVLNSDTVTVNWNQNISFATNWVVTAGTSNVAGPAAYNILLPAHAGPTATSQTLSGLPIDGSSFYINLYALINGNWSIVSSISVNAFDAPSPEITTPDPGTLGSGSVTVNWNANGNTPDNWVVTAGTSNVAGPSAYNLLLPEHAGPSATSQTLSGLPVDGSSFYINLYALENGVWSIVDSTSVTAFTAPQPAITSPTGSSTLTSGSVTVNWNPNGNTPDNWVVTAGTSNVAGTAAYNIALPTVLDTSATSQTLTGLPIDGSGFYINLYAFENGAWSIKDSISVTAFTAPQPAITSPTGGSTLTSGSVTVNWNANGNTPDNWVVTAGTSNVAGPAAYNILLPSVVGTSATSQTLTGLPIDGSGFYINLYAFENGAWSIKDSISVTAFTAPQPAITSPTGGSTLASSSVTVNWNANGNTPDNWVVTAGTSNVAGTAAYNIALPTVLDTSATSQTLTGLPIDGSGFYINLYAFENGAWSIKDSTSVTAFTAPQPAITSPTGGSTLTSGSVTVNWNPNGNTPDNWVVTAGTSNVAGTAAYNIALPTVLDTSATSQTLTGLPIDGSGFYINLYAFENGAWSIKDSISVTAFTAPQPAITSPTGGSTLTSGSVTVNWNANGNTPENWVVTAGTSNVAGPSAYNLLLPAHAGPAATSQTLSGLPTDGRSFYINLYALENGAWSIVDSISITAPAWISGTFNVSGSFSYSGCSNPSLNVTRSFTGTYSSNAQDGNSYSGYLSLTTLNGFNLAAQGLAVNSSFSGTHSQTNASGSYTLDAYGQGALQSRNQGNFSGNLSGNSISVSGSGNDVFGETCSINYNFSGPRQ